MSARLRWIFACAAVGVFATVVAAGPTALAHDRKDRKQERHHKSKERGKDDRVGKAPVRSYVELSRQIDELRQQLAALGQLPGEMSTIKVSVNSLATQYSHDMKQLRGDFVGLAAAVGDLDQRLGVLDGGGSGGSTPPAAYDALEQRMGPVIGMEQPPALRDGAIVNEAVGSWVAFNVEGRFFALRVLYDRLAGAPVHFSNVGCQGTAYLGPLDLEASAPPRSISQAGVQNGVVYVAGAHAIPAATAVRSTLGVDGLCSSFPAMNRTLVQAAVVTLPAFTPPFAVR